MSVFPQTNVPPLFGCVTAKQRRRVASPAAISAATIFVGVAAAIVDVGIIHAIITASAGVALNGSAFRGIIIIAIDVLHF